MNGYEKKTINKHDYTRGNLFPVKSWLEVKKSRKPGARKAGLTVTEIKK